MGSLTINLSVGIKVVEFTRELNKESLLDYYPIYINYTWSVLQIITPALKSMYHP